MTRSEPGQGRLDLRPLAVAAQASESVPDHPLIDAGDFQICRTRRGSGQLLLGRLPSHSFSMQQSMIRVKARFGDDRFAGVASHGDMSFCPAGHLMDVAWQQTLDVVAVHVSPAYVARVLEGAPLEIAPFFYRSDPELAPLFVLLSRNADAGEPYGRVLREGLVTSLVAALGGWRQRALIGEAARLGLPPVRLRRVLEYIESHLADDIPLASLAAEASVSQRHFSSVFHRIMGRPPHRFLIERRLEKAKLLLRADRSMTITEIAIGVGFNSSAHFATTFRRMVGMTPRDYRRGM